MTTEQIYTVVNSAATQALGQGAIAVIDTASFISLGNAVLSSSVNTEAFLNTLAQRIGRTIISFREYKNRMRDLVLNDFEYGAILQKIKVAMPTAEEDESYTLTDGQSVDHYKVSKPVVNQKLFVTRTPYQFKITIQREHLKEAFLSESAMGGFLAAIFGEVRNAIEFALENLGRGAYANYIAEVAGGAREIKLVTEFNGLGGNVTAGNALTNKDFLNYAFRRINEHIDYFQDMSVLFNDGSATRHTPKADIRIKLLSPFVRAAETVTQYAAFNETLVDVADTYTPVSYWQSPNNRSQVIAQRASDDEATTVSNVIGVMHDRDALGIYQMNEVVATTPINAAGLYYNQYYHERQLWFNDLSENFVIFTLN
ncbi:MAG: hypothetical protein J6A79_16490 [Clostridia bacterium]|nr:hypothetical protein [Clostridia bacterium]